MMNTKKVNRSLHTDTLIVTFSCFPTFEIVFQTKYHQFQTHLSPIIMQINLIVYSNMFCQFVDTECKSIMSKM